MGRTKHYDMGGNQVSTNQIHRAVSQHRALLVSEDDCLTMYLAIFDSRSEAAAAYRWYNASDEDGGVAQWPTVEMAMVISCAVHRWEGFARN